MTAVSQWHDRGGVAWRITPLGVEVEDEGVMRTPGEPQSVRLYWAWWARHFMAASAETGVPIGLLLMTVAVENGSYRADEKGRPRVVPVRKEPHYISDEETPGQISVGPCHLLISTARATMKDPAIDRAWLLEVGNNIRAAACYIAAQEPETRLDPVLVAACYNAGGLYAAAPGQLRGNRWWLRTTGDHLDRAARWYGDACAVIREAHELVARGRAA